MAKAKSKPLDSGTLIDRLYKVRARRLALQKDVEDLKSEERLAEQEIYSLLDAQGLRKATGAIASFSWKEVPVPSVGDWSKLHDFIMKNDAFELLQKRVSVEACRERWDDGLEIPGVERIGKVEFSLRASGA
jgi:hypothetical protein